MSKTTFMDTILNRPSQRYTEPVHNKPSRTYGAPTDLPNAPNRPNSILAGNMFSSNGLGSLSQAGGTYSRAPSVMSGKSNTSRFSLFGRKKKQAPSISGGSVYHDGNSSIAPSEVANARKGNWWEAGRNKYSSRPPSVAGSVFSEPDQAGPPGFPRISDSLNSTLPRRGARSDYGGPTSSRKRYSSNPAPPPMPSIASKSSMSSLKRQSGVAPLGHQAPNLMRQASTVSNASLAQGADQARPVSPAASMGRTRTQSRIAQGGASDWNSFVQSMKGTEVAQLWETMPTLAPKPSSRIGEKRSSVVANRVKKELEGDAQYQQIQRDPGVAQQNLLARAASQVIGEAPPTPVSPLGSPQPPAVHLQPGQVVAPISPVYSPVASSSSVNVAQYPPSMSLQASTVMSRAPVPAPVLLQQPVPPMPMTYAAQPQQYDQQYMQQYQQQYAQQYPQQYPQQHPQQYPQQYIQPQAQQYVQPQAQQYVQPQAQHLTQQYVQAPVVPQQYVQPGNIVAPQQVGVPQQIVPEPLRVASPPVQAVSPPPVQAVLPPVQTMSPPHQIASPPVPQNPPTQTYAPVAVAAPRAAVQPAVQTQHVTPAPASPTRSPAPVAQPALSSLPAAVAPPTTAQYLASRIEEQESGEEQPSADEEEESSAEESDESEESDTSSEEGLVAQPTLGVLAEEDEEASSIGHNQHNEMRYHASIKGKGPSRKYDDVQARLHSRQVSAQTQQDESVDESPAIASPAVQIHVTQPSEVLDAREAHAAQSADPTGEATSQLAVTPQRPQLVSRTSEATEYQSVASGRSTPTATGEAAEEDADESAVASITQAQIRHKPSKESMSGDTASIAAPSVRPRITQKRLSELSLGTSFAVSGILGGRSGDSAMRRSDSAAGSEDDDAELRNKSLAEQDRLRNMNVGEDFFGPSFSNMLDKFENFGYSNTTVNKLEGETDQPSASAGSAVAPTASLTTANGELTPEAQKALNEVRQKRVDEGKSRSSADTGLAPSLAAVWMLNQSQSTDSPALERPAPQDAGDTTITSSTVPTETSKDIVPAAATVAAPEQPKVSVLDRARPIRRKPTETDDVATSEDKVEPETAPNPGLPVEDAHTSLPTSVSQASQVSNSTAGAVTPMAQSNQTTPTKATHVVITIKDKPAPAKTEVKTKAPRSLADTLFGIQWGSPSKDKKEKKERKEKEKREKKEKKEKKKHARKASVDSVGSASLKSDRSSLVGSSKGGSSTDSAVVSAVASPVASVPASPSAKALGKQRMTDEPSAMVPSETVNNFATPAQSMANLNGAAGPQSSPEKYHTAHDLRALADTSIPVHPMELATKHAAQASTAANLPTPAVVQQDAVEDAASAPPTSSESSLASTALTSPDSEAAYKAMKTDTAVTTEAPVSGAAPAIASAMSSDEKRLPMPPPQAVEDVMAGSQDDRTPMGRPEPVPGVGINLIPPTPPAFESRNSFTHSQVPGTPTITEHENGTIPQRPALMSRSSSQRTAGKSDSKANGSSDNLSRSKSMAPAKKSFWQEYKGKGLSLPPGLVATTIDSSQLRQKKSQPAPAPAPSTVQSALPVAPVVGQVLVPAPQSVTESPTRSVRASPSSVSSHSPKRRSASPGHSPSPSMNRLMVDAPPVPPIPVGYQGVGSANGSPSRFYAPSLASSADHGWEDSRSASPAPSAVPSQSGRSVASHVSSSVHSASYRSSPRPEFTYVNHHELSPYAKKMRALSPSPAMPTLTQTGNRHSLMSAINEWESQVPEGEAASGLSPYPSRPTSPHPYPTLPASTVSRGSSVISSVSSPAVVRNAPLGASTNQYLHPPIARSRMGDDALSTVGESVAGESLNPPSVIGHGSAGGSSADSSPSASQSALSLSSTIPTSMPTVPTSYRPNKDPKRFSKQVDDLLNSRTTMQSVAVTSGAFARNKSVKRKSSKDLGRNSSDIPEHLQDELSQTTLGITAHTPPPRKIGSHQVLVQVIAVAIDETDKLLLREKVRGENAFGYVPGRSFCGRIVECGYEVKKMRKGDVVFGLQDSRKSGALAEFMVVDDTRICHAPSDCLTTEQIAALPSAGVMAHQLVQNHCRPLSRGARVLILNAHDGVGLLTMQESVGLGLVIVAQCPPSISDGVAVCQANGAHEVVIGEPLWAINSLHESSFDLIIDTVGGRKIYDASRRILAFEGQFCTCYGDEHGTANPNLKSHFRSLRRAFFKKDKKNIGYEWVGVDTGEDCKEALEAVKVAAEGGDICPRLRSVLPFADAPRAFDPNSKRSMGEEEPGAIVVRVS